MILSVRHVTTYRYDRPVRAVIQSHRLEPARFDGQQVLDWRVEVSNGIRGGGFRDGAGDWVQGWTIPGPLEAVTVSVTGRVATTDTAGVLQGHREKTPPEAWLRTTPATRCDPGLAELAQAAGDGLAGLDLAHALAGAVAEAVAYTPGATDTRTSAAEALAKGSGVCQDHAQVLIALARRRDLPARYVSGYLLADDEGQERTRPRMPGPRSGSTAWAGWASTRPTAAARTRAMSGWARGSMRVMPPRSAASPVAAGKRRWT